LEWAGSIPGTVGGAVCTNAGAFNAAFWDYVRYVDVVAAGGSIMRLGPKDVIHSYRKTQFPIPKPFAVTEVGLELERSDPGAVASLAASYKLRREASQPLGVASAGCVFKNPPGDEPAGALIEKAGLKGARRGSAVVSEKHANFIVNEGGASAAEIYELIGFVRDQVRQQFGVELETEIEYLGAFR